MSFNYHEKEKRNFTFWKICKNATSFSNKCRFRKIIEMQKGNLYFVSKDRRKKIFLVF